MQKWIQPPACSVHGLHRILSSYWLAHCYLMKKSTKVYLFLGLDFRIFWFLKRMLWPLWSPWLYSIHISSLCTCSACSSVFPFFKCSFNPQHARKELMRAMSNMSMHIRNCWVGWAYASGTDACAELMSQELVRAQIAVPLKHAEHTHKELVHLEHTG